MTARSNNIIINVTKTTSTDSANDIDKTFQQTFLKVSQTATTTQVGHTAIATRLSNATNGAELMAIVTPATVSMRPCFSANKKLNFIKAGIKIMLYPSFNWMPYLKALDLMKSLKASHKKLEEQNVPM